MRLAARFSMALIGFVLAAPVAARADDINRAVVGLGAYDVLNDKTAVALDLEWRPGVRYFGWVAPFVGGFITTRGSIYGYAGFGVDIPIGERIRVLPFTSIGAYGQGDGRDLGSVLEFRTGLEVAYRFDDGSMLGLSGFHVSNAGIGDDNPGTELLMLHYAFPIGDIFQ